jgi:hypothetical protein
MKTTAETKEKRAVEATQARSEHHAKQRQVDDNMHRLRTERLARETLPQTQGEKEKPRRPAKSSKKQNAADRP